MSMQEAQREAFAQYKKKADAARQARAEAKQARRLSDRTATTHPDSEKLSTAASKAEDKAATAEKQRHLARLKTKDTHQPGEENGCVTRCVWRNPRRFPYGRRCLFAGHNHKENAIKYHVAHERHWYNLPFHRKGNRARQRLEAALGFRYKPAPTDKARDRREGRRLELRMRLAAREDRNNPLVTAGAWDMGLSGDNFWSGRKKPWNHEAHHVIPTDVLYQSFEEDMSLLQQLKYNVNRGVNVLILPTQRLLGWVFLLPAHVNQHVGYSREVKRRIQGVRKRAAKEQSKQEGHPDMSEARNEPWKSQLEAYSKSLRKMLRKAALREGRSGRYKYLTLDDAFQKPLGGLTSS